MYKLRPVLTSYFDVSKLQKQFRIIIQIHLDQSANFCSLPLNVCVTVSHNVAFNCINRKKRHEMQQIETNALMKHRNKLLPTIL